MTTYQNLPHYLLNPIEVTLAAGQHPDYDQPALVSSYPHDGRILHIVVETNGHEVEYPRESETWLVSPMEIRKVRFGAIGTIVYTRPLRRTKRVDGSHPTVADIIDTGTWDGTIVDNDKTRFTRRGHFEDVEVEHEANGEETLRLTFPVLKTRAPCSPSGWWEKLFNQVIEIRRFQRSHLAEGCIKGWGYLEDKPVRIKLSPPA